VFDAPATFFADFEVAPGDQLVVATRAVAVGAIFSGVGAATADSVF
jgi:uncharacterized membrane protein